MNDHLTQLIDKWADDTGQQSTEWADIVEPPNKGIAAELLVHDEARWVNGDAAAVTALGTALFHSSPTATGPLRPLEALSLASACYRYELVPGPVEDARDTAAIVHRVQRMLVRCIWDDATVSDAELLRRTVYWAVRDVGDASDLDIPRWAFYALGDHESGWYLSEDQYERIAVACVNRKPGRRWAHVTGIGYVTWTLSPQPLSTAFESHTEKPR